MDFKLICCIVNCGRGSKVLKIAKQHGVEAGTLCLGRGTIKNYLLELLDLTDIRKEIVFMISEASIAEKATMAIIKEMEFHKPYHGIAFSFSLTNFLGNKNYEYNSEKINEENKTMYNSIFAVVDKGRAEDVIEAANKAGSKGGTIINARGSGIHETHTLFAMAIEPEKELVMILTENALTKGVVESINKELKIDEAGNGIVFVLNVDNAYGLY